MTNCEYSEICKHYVLDCDAREDKDVCWIYVALEGIINKEVFKSRINKRIFREEHGHKGYETTKKM